MKVFRGGVWLTLHEHPRRRVSQQPFGSYSIWNRPIGESADFRASGLAPATLRQPYGWPEITSDPENIGMDGDYPLVSITGPTRTVQARIPSHVSDANGSWNNCYAGIAADGVTIQQGQPLNWTQGASTASCAYGLKADQEVAITDEDGAYGSHGGSKLSGIGGSIRMVKWRGELISELELPMPMRHALKINVFGERFLSHQTGGGTGYVWPATAADNNYDTPGTNNYYGSSNTRMGMGTLLALPTPPNPSTITEPRAYKIAVALYEYGTYIVDNTARDVHAFAAEKGAFPGAPEPVTPDDEAFHVQLMSVITDLRVVANNSAGPTAGGGAPRAMALPAVEIV